MVVRCQCIAAPRALRTVRQLYFRKMIVCFTFIASSKFICYTVSKHFTKEVHILQSDYLQWWALKTQHQLKVSLFLGYPLPRITSLHHTIYSISYFRKVGYIVTSPFHRLFSNVRQKRCLRFYQPMYIILRHLNNPLHLRFIVENILKPRSNIHGFWINLSDRVEEGTFVWGDGTTADAAITDWGNGQPDNTNDADCTVVAQYLNHQFDDVPCEGSNNAILCEKYVGF